MTHDMRYYTLDVTRRLLREGAPVKGTSPEKVTGYAMDNCFDPGSLYRESAFLVFLDKNGNIRGHFLLGTGGISAVTMDVRLACLALLETGCRNAVLLHNHPEGNPRPSQGDIKVTENLKKAFNTLDCCLADHVIIGDGCIFSFSLEKVIPYTGTQAA